MVWWGGGGDPAYIVGSRFWALLRGDYRGISCSKRGITQVDREGRKFVAGAAA
jgi:hypothetical protein